MWFFRMFWDILQNARSAAPYMFAAFSVGGILIFIKQFMQVMLNFLPDDPFVYYIDSMPSSIFDIVSYSSLIIDWNILSWFVNIALFGIPYVIFLSIWRRFRG